jgi:isopenicillin N synthase-like dioxygenase
MKCRTISFDSKSFAEEVLAALQSDRVFVLTNLPDDLRLATQDLIKSGDDFFDHIHEYNKDEYPAKIEENNVRGLFGPEKYPLLCNNGARFFIGMNREGGINNEKMPEYDNAPVMSESAKMFKSHTDSIIIRVLTAIGTELNIDPDLLIKNIIGSEAIGITRYYPITQKRAVQMFDDNVLAVSGNEIEQFGQHRDINPVTILAYRDKPRGLVAYDKDSKKMLPLLVENNNQPYLLLFTGTILKEMTNGRIRALKHQVVTSPEEQHQEALAHPHQWRFTLAKFTYFHGNELQPLVTLNGQAISPPAPRKHQRKYPLAPGQFFMEHLATESEIREKSKISELPSTITAQYPSHVKHVDLYAAQLGEKSIGIYKN